MLLRRNRRKNTGSLEVVAEDAVVTGLLDIRFVAVYRLQGCVGVDGHSRRTVTYDGPLRFVSSSGKFQRLLRRKGTVYHV